MDRLSRRAKEAERLGMSYGKYMALRASGALTEEEEAPDGKGEAQGYALCPECGKRFRPVRKGHTFCSTTCASRKRTRERYRREHGLNETDGKKR